MRNIIYKESDVGLTIDRIVRNYDFNMPHKHIHEEYEIYYLIDGERYYFIENQIFHVKKGSLVFINRNQIHQTGQYNDSHHERIVIELKEEPFSSFLGCTGELVLSDFFCKNQGVLELCPKNQSYVLSLLEGIAGEIRDKNPGYRMMAMTKLARLLFFAQRFWNNNHLTASTTALSTSSTHQKVSEVASYISEHYDTASSLDTVAQHFYISKSYLSRIFKEFTGYTVNEYINLNRIQQAQNLLIKSNMNITEIASSLGYESLTYFEKIFRKYTETSPLQYRKRFLKESERPKSYAGEQINLK